MGIHNYLQSVGLIALQNDTDQRYVNAKQRRRVNNFRSETLSEAHNIEETRGAPFSRFKTWIVNSRLYNTARRITREFTYRWTSVSGL